jgi:8-oxo-dGTP diphosphatase
MDKVSFGLKRTATICILRNKDKFLLLKRLKEPHIGSFTPVGGKLDPFESPLKSAIRETFEETGIRLSEMKFYGILTESSPSEYNWTGYVYVAEIEFIPPPDCNEGTLEWIAFSNLLHVPTPKVDWHIYKYVLDNRPFAFSAEYDENLTLVSMVEEFENIKVI